jgi:hypothetical protein
LLLDVFILIRLKNFFSQGNATTGGFCSKCWNETQKTKSAVAEAQVVAPSSPGSEEVSKEKATAASPEKVPSLVIDASSIGESAETLEDTTNNTPKSSSSTAATETPALTTTENVNAAAVAPIKKKKKKKASYKNMMASITQQSLSRDDDKEKDDAIRKVTGGGAFSKITKI